MAENEYNALFGTIEQVNEAVETSTESVRSNIPAWNDLSAQQRTTAEKIASAYREMKEAVIDSIESQMNMFEKWNEAEEISTETLLDNMQSQIDGITNWEENLNTLIDRGINDDLLQTLLEMGPKGANYVQTFVNMSDEEMAKANALWEQSLDIKGFTNDIGKQLNEGMASIAADMDDTGMNLGKGLARGLTSAKALVVAAAKDMANAAVNETKNVLQVQSPSKVFEWIGEMTGEGFQKGLEESFGAANKWLQNDLAAMTNYSHPQLDTNAIYSAVRNGAEDAATHIYLDDRELTRGLKGLGVAFA